MKLSLEIKDEFIQLLSTQLCIQSINSNFHVEVNEQRSHFENFKEIISNAIKKAQRSNYIHKVCEDNN
jgi:hypothetical protein